MKNKGMILIISGPSGCGKSTVLSRVFAGLEKYFFSISATTRKARPGEENGVDYHFISREEFDEMLKNDEFLEHATYVNNSYGTPLKPIYDHLSEGYVVILDIEVQGFMQVREKMPEAIAVFIAPPSVEELENRLRGRGTESEEKIAKRLETAKKELTYKHLYDYVVINDDVDRASAEILEIISKYN